MRGGIRDKEGEGKNGRTSPPVFTTYHRKSMIARTARFNEIPFPFLYMPPSHPSFRPFLRFLYTSRCENLSCHTSPWTEDGEA